MTELVWSFAPWILFLLIDRLGARWLAIGAGLVAAAVALVRAIARHKVHLLDVVSPVYFGLLAVVLAIVRPDDLDTWSKYAQAGSHAVLTVLVFGSVLVGPPFTIAYAKERVPETDWHSAQFLKVDRDIALRWDSRSWSARPRSIVAGVTDTLPFVLRVLIPFGALYLAYTYTQKVASQGRGPAPEAAAEALPAFVRPADLSRPEWPAAEGRRRAARQRPHGPPRTCRSGHGAWR